jgi:hypothetical protein
MLLFFSNINMSSAIDRLVPVLNGTNWHDWSVMMKAYLNIQELWEICSSINMPTEPQPTAREEVVQGVRQCIRVPVPDTDMAAYR